MRRRIEAKPTDGDPALRLAGRIPEFGTKSSLVAQAIRDAIISGQIKPGSSLRQRELSTMFGVSETPIREALFQLQAEGLVVRSPHKDVTVPESPSRAIAETYLMRMSLEGLAVWFATSRISDGEVDQLAQINRKLRAAIKHANHLDKHKCNREFHFSLYSKSGMPRLLAQIQNLWNSFPHGTVERVPGRAEESAREHEVILVAMRSGNAGEATSLMIKHIGNGAKALAHEIASRTGIMVGNLDTMLGEIQAQVETAGKIWRGT